MHPCPDCGCHVRLRERACPHCGTTITKVTRTYSASAALLGLAIACSGKDGVTTDSGVPTTTDSYTTPSEADYGVSSYTDSTSDADADADADSDADADADSDADADADSGTVTGGSGTATPTTTSGSGEVISPDYGSPYTY